MAFLEIMRILVYVTFQKMVYDIKINITFGNLVC